MEMFPLSDLAQRLSPMAELIGEDDQPLEFNSLVTASHLATAPSATSSWDEPSSRSSVASADTYRETLPASHPPARLEPQTAEVEEFEFTDNVGDADQLGAVEATDFESPDDVTASAPLDLDESFESHPALAEEPAAFEPSEPYDESEGEDFDENQFEIASEERLPVTGPVAPRPLSSVAARDFGNAAVSMAPRKRKKSSPVKSAIKMILGGVAGLAIGGAILEFAGRPLFWPFDGTISGKIKSNPPMQLSDSRPARPANPGRSLAEDLSPAPGDSAPEMTTSDAAAANPPASDAGGEGNSEPASPIQPPAPANDAQANDTQTNDTQANDAATNELQANAAAQTQPEATHAAADEPPQANDVAAPSDATDATATPPPSVSELVMPVPPTTTDDASPRDPAPAAEQSPDRSTPETPLESPTDPAPTAITMPAEAAPTSEPSTAENSSKIEPVTPEKADTQEPSKATPEEPATPAAAASSSVSFAPPASSELKAAIEQTDAALTKVVEFEDLSDGSGLRTSKASLYVALANLALYPQDLSQPETAAAIERVDQANLIADMKKAAPPWLRYTKRPNEGLFAAGTVVRVNDDWVLQWNGERDLQLQNVDSKLIQSGDQVVLLGRIIDANPPAIVQVVYIQKQDPQ